MKQQYLLVLLLVGCSLRNDFEYESHRELVVVNGLINPDSIIVIELSKSGSFPGGNEFSRINNAIVEIFENDISLGNLEFDPYRQAYSLDYYPKPGAVYSLVVQPVAYPLLTASTTIPEDMQVNACYRRNPLYNYAIVADLALQNDFSASSYWLSVLSKVYEMIPVDTFPYSIYDSSRVITKRVTGLYSASPIIDRFNGINDEGKNLYDFYLRFNATEADEKILIDVYSLETDLFFTYNRIQNISEDLGLYIHLFRVSEEMDRYWKSSLINYLNSNFESDIPNPFAEQVVSYSNVANGAGVFAGYNSQILSLHDAPCD